MKQLSPLLFMLLAGAAYGQSTQAIGNFPFNFPSPAPTTTKTLQWDPAASNALGGTGAVVFATPSAGAGIGSDAFWAAKGDLAVGTANDTASVLSVGSANQVLTVDSSTATGLKWATPTAGGTGTVTNTGGNLTANSVVLGAGTVDTKVVPGITTSGTAKLILGQTSTSTGQIDLKNGTGTTTIQPTASSGTVTVNLPGSGSGTLVFAGTSLSDYGITDAQPADTDLTTLAGLTATTDNFIVSVANAWASRTPSQVRTTLGLVIGTNVQAYDADLTTWAGITPGTGVGTALAINVGSAGAFVTTSSTDTLTNKTISSSVIQPRVTNSSTSNTTPTPNCDTDDIYNAVSMTVNMAFGAPTGTPFAGQKLIIKIQGTAARTVSFATGSSGAYRFSTDIPVPTTTTTTKLMYLGFIWNNGDSRWDCVARTDGF